MSDLMKKIYEGVIQHERVTVEMGNRVDRWVDELTAPYKGQLDAGQMEQLRNLMYSTAIKAEEEGFQLGIRVIVKLVLEMVSDS